MKRYKIEENVFLYLSSFLFFELDIWLYKIVTREKKTNDCLDCHMRQKIFLDLSPVKHPDFHRTKYN
jgi:hypothetical protein